MTNTKLVRKLNRKAAIWHFVDAHLGWAIALCYIACYGLIRGIAGS